MPWVRVGGMTENGGSLATATCGVAGQVAALSYFGFSETRTYNSLLQMTRQSAGGVLDTEYLYPAGTNNGRITSSVDHVLNETVNYTYDALNRLTRAETTGSVDTETNVAVGKTATQSSTVLGSVASRAVDGNTNGDWNANSVTHTDYTAWPWWQVDLGALTTISSVEIWNRTDAAPDRLSDYWVFISNTPFTSSDTPANLPTRQGTWSIHKFGYPNPNTTIQVGGYVGRYVRVQLNGINYLSLAEVKVNGTTGWGQSYGYDGFGNLTATKGTVPTLSVAYDGTTNHQMGVSYDANGNTGGQFDVENRMVVDWGGRGWAYDPSGKRVYQEKGASGMEYYVYGMGGQKLVTVKCGYHTYQQGTPDEHTELECANSNHVYFAGKLVKSNGVAVATDRLGSVRGNANGEVLAYYPYGEERGTSADGREKFGTYTRDSVTQDYADQRYYAVGMGRFNTPDPYQATGGVANPSSWNRYAYTMGDPINGKDPRGLFTCLPACAPTPSPEPAPSPSPLVLPQGPSSLPEQEICQAEAGCTSEPLPDPTPVPKTDAEMRDELLKGLKRAGDILNSNADCAGLFGGGPYPSATTLLAQIDNSFTFGSIDSKDGTVTSATTTGNGQVMYGAIPLNTSVTIKLNNRSPGASFVSGDVNDWAATILHELGHAVYDLYGAYASKITPDGEDTALSEANTKLIKEKCKL